MPTFPQSVTDVDTPEASREAAARLARAPELAVDLEADSMHAFRARLCFVQVASDQEVCLFDTLQPGVEALALAAQMEDEGVTKYFHAAMGDLAYLAEAGVRVKGLFDTHRAATLLGWPKVGLADLARERLGVELPKEFQQADWSVRPLKPGMRDYLANDVRYLVELGRQVRQACREADVLEEVQLDCARMCAEAEARPPEGQEWRPKLPRQGANKAQLELGFAIARVLHGLRLRWAEAANVPMGRMLSNMAITEIALKPPTSAAELGKRPGVRGSFVRQHGEEVLAAVRALVEQQQAGTLPPEEVAKKPDPKRKKREEALTAWRRERAAERKVTPGVVLPNPLAEQLVASPPRTVEELGQVPFLGEKRVRLYGEQLVRLLAEAG
jgi:ribonuclease D